MFLNKIVKLMKHQDATKNFSFICFLLPVIGSGVSFIWHGGAIWSLINIIYGKFRLSKDSYFYILCCLIYTYIASSVLSFFINDPHWADARHLVPLITFVLFPFSYSVWSTPPKKDVADAIALGSAFASYGALGLALVQYFAFGMRAEGGAGNALVFATVTCMVGATSLASALLLDTQRTAFLGSGYLAAVPAVILSGSRSIWLVMLITSLTILAIGHKRALSLVRDHLGKLAIVFLGILTLSVGMIVQRIDSLVLDWTKLMEAEQFDTSLGYRAALWEIAAERIIEKPLLGHGLQHTRELIVNGLKTDFGVESYFTHFHNGFLTLLVESGIVGGGSIIAIFIFIFWIALRTIRSNQDHNTRFGSALLLIFCLSYTIGGSFNIVLGHDIYDVTFIIFLITGTFLARETSKSPSGVTRKA